MTINATYQFVVFFFSYRLGRYLKVASVQACLTEDVLDQVFATLNGKPAPDGMRVRPFFQDGKSLLGYRTMQVGDVVEVNGKAYYATEDSWAQIEYRSDHGYERYSSPINDILTAVELAAAAIPA